MRIETGGRVDGQARLLSGPGDAGMLAVGCPGRRFGGLMAWAGFCGNMHKVAM